MIYVYFTFRIYEWAPYMPSDMQWFVKEFRNILQEIFHVIQCHRHRYSARFVVYSVNSSCSNQMYRSARTFKVSSTRLWPDLSQFLKRHLKCLTLSPDTLKTKRNNQDIDQAIVSYALSGQLGHLHPWTFQCLIMPQILDCPDFERSRLICTLVTKHMLII